MKYAQRLDDARLAEVLNERGMADLEAIRDLLHAAQSGGTSFAEALVNTGLIGDWDLSRVVAEIFQLPFLPVDMVKPEAELWEELDEAFLTKHGLVPIHQFGQVLTVAMPGLVPADVLGALASKSDLVVLPVVGTVESNRRWLFDQGRVAPKVRGSSAGGDWSAMFDAADAAVQMDLDSIADDEADPAEALDVPDDVESELAGLDDLEFTDAADEDDDGPASLVGLGDDEDEDEEEPAPRGRGGIELPPMPEFG